MLAPPRRPSRPRCPARRVDAVVRHLFGTIGLHGDRETYYDPANSLLHRVLDRRRGIPITLSIVTIEVGRRVGLDLVGVGMPGHFLVGDPTSRPVRRPVLRRRRCSTATACRRAVPAPARAGRPRSPTTYLDPVGPRAIVARVLANLRADLHARGVSRRQLGRGPAAAVAPSPGVGGVENAPSWPRRSSAIGRFDEAAAELRRGRASRRRARRRPARARPSRGTAGPD